MLNQFFNPKSIALIGASRTKGKVGYEILKNLLRYGYKGKIYPVNPKAKKILGKRCFAFVLDVPEKIDLAVIMVPAKIVPQVLKECGQKKIPGAIIISAGFKEIGKEGAKLEDKIKEIAKKYNIKILGPNCLGIINTKNNLNTSFISGMPKRGNISLISQSGALVSAILDWTTENNLGLAKIITLGNKAGITENEALECLLSDPETEVVMMYLEDFKDGTEFIQINMRMFMNRYAKKKSVLVLKAGRSEAGEKAAKSHTGALAASDEAVDIALKRCGAIRIQDLEDFFNLAKAFSSQPLPQNNKIAVITNAGGLGVMAADVLTSQKSKVKSQKYIELAKLSNKTKRFLQKNLPKAASVDNPIDLLGDALAERYQMALEAVLKDKNVGGVIVILTPQAMAEEDETARIIGKMTAKLSSRGAILEATKDPVAKNKKPILTSFIGGSDISSALKILAKNKIPNYDYPEAAVEVMGQMWHANLNANYTRIKYEFAKLTGVPSETKRRMVRTTLQKIKQKKLKQIEALDAEKILRYYNIPVIKSYSVNGVPSKAKRRMAKIAKKIGYPVVLKIADPRIVHKTEKGGVILNIKDEKELKVVYKKLPNFQASKLPSYLVQKMIKGGQEVIVGMKRDPQFGPLLMFGLGGIFTEVLEDVSFGLAPLSRQEAKEMIFKTKGSKILVGFRNQKPSDINSLIDILVKLSQLSLDFPEIKEIDLNPIKVFEKGKGSVCVDVKILLN